MNIRLVHFAASAKQEAALAPNPLGVPGLLTSFVSLKSFLKHRDRYTFRDWVLDSGAYSAHTSGVVIDLAEYTATCKHLLKTDPTLSEVFALDVIGDWRASLRNTERMWADGVPAIPCYHLGEPDDVLIGLARDYPKIALGGVAHRTAKRKRAWAAQCFARVWPKAIHGFGFGSETAVMSLPWHSTDATNWETGPCAFGRWFAYGGDMSVRGGFQNLRAEVEWFVRLEQRARQRWATEMDRLGVGPVTVRLANACNSASRLRTLEGGQS